MQTFIDNMEKKFQLALLNTVEMSIFRLICERKRLPLGFPTIFNIRPSHFVSFSQHK